MNICSHGCRYAHRTDFTKGFVCTAPLPIWAQKEIIRTSMIDRVVPQQDGEEDKAKQECASYEMSKA